MQVSTTKKIGSKTYIFTGEGQNLHECVMELRKFSFGDVHQCGLCNSKDLSLEAYVTKKDSYKYTIVRCNECSGVLTFGQPKKDPDTAYLRKKDNGEYEWREWHPSDAD